MMFLPEWAPQKGVLLAFPHEQSDWASVLPEAFETYAALIKAILPQPVILLCDDIAFVKEFLQSRKVDCGAITFVRYLTNDTWTRDYGPITLQDEDGNLLLKDFLFTGWGLKFAADRDNQANVFLKENGFFGEMPMEPGNLALEGGGLESDGAGTLLTTTHCLLSTNRNPNPDKEAMTAKLQDDLGVERVLWLERGRLEGDDTDSHIDMLARFVDEKSIVYVTCDPSDPHYEELTAMEEELKNFRTLEGEPYRLTALPLPKLLDEEGDRLPATYANFLILNEKVLVPQYGLPEDAKAVATLQRLFPDRTMVPVECRVLIGQGGAVHCATMQLY